MSAIGGLKLSRAAKPSDLLLKLRMCNAVEFVCRLAGRFAIIGAERDERRAHGKIRERHLKVAFWILLDFLPGYVLERQYRELSGRRGLLRPNTAETVVVSANGNCRTW